MDEFTTIFSDDARKRGFYISPFTVQTLNADGTVKETHTLSHDGVQNVVKGGNPGVPPNAPEGFKSPCIIEVGGNKKKSAAGEKMRGGGENETADTKRAKKDVKDDSVDFDAAFAKNLSGAFI